MERIGVENARHNLTNIIKRVEAGEEIILTRYGRDVAYIASPGTNDAHKRETFFALLKKLKAHSPIKATPEEIGEWIEEGRT